MNETTSKTARKISSEAYKKLSKSFQRGVTFPILGFSLSIVLLIGGGIYGNKTGAKFERETQNNSPINISYKHLNSDGIEDRVISNSAGLYQEQFGYVNPESGTTEYLTIGQIQE